MSRTHELISAIYAATLLPEDFNRKFDDLDNLLFDGGDGGNLQLAIEAAGLNGVFHPAAMRVGAGIDLAITLPGGATFRGGVDLSGTGADTLTLR